MSGLIINPYAFGGAGAGGEEIVVDAAHFDSTDLLTRGAQLTGVSDTKLLTAVLWLRAGSFPQTHALIGGVSPGDAAGADGSAPTFSVTTRNTPRDTVRITGRNSSGNIILNLNSSSTMLINTWYCLMVSVDLADTGKRHYYLGDTNAIEVATYTNAQIDVTVNDFSVGGEPDGPNRFTGGALAEVFYAPGHYIDFSVAANRRKFFSANGKPVGIGSDGSVPFGVKPAVYLHLDNGEAVANFATNRGAGGNLSITGTLTTAGTSPSD